MKIATLYRKDGKVILETDNDAIAQVATDTPRDVVVMAAHYFTGERQVGRPAALAAPYGQNVPPHGMVAGRIDAAILGRAMVKHQLWEKGDAGLPTVLTDRNGDVVLGMCRVCGQAEAELEDTCPGYEWPEGARALAGEIAAAVFADETDEVRARLHRQLFYASAAAAVSCTPSDLGKLLDDHARLRDKVTALHWCAWDRDECTVTLAFESEQQVIEFIGQHPVRGRVQTLPEAAPAIDLEQFRRLAYGWVVEAGGVAADVKHACADELLALIDGQAGDNGVRVDRGALQMAINVLRRAGKDEVADALAGGVIEQPTKGEGE